jgi:hypothetical protein
MNGRENLVAKDEEELEECGDDGSHWELIDSCLAVSHGPGLKTN